MIKREAVRKKAYIVGKDTLSEEGKARAMGQPKADYVHSLSTRKQPKLVLHHQSLLVPDTFG